MERQSGEMRLENKIEEKEGGHVHHPALNPDPFKRIFPEQSGTPRSPFTLGHSK